jgi:hypothetical protein
MAIQIAVPRKTRQPSPRITVSLVRVSANGPSHRSDCEDFRCDSDSFGEGVRSPEAERQIGAALKLGLQTRDREMVLARVLGGLTDAKR